MVFKMRLGFLWFPMVSCGFPVIFADRPSPITHRPSPIVHRSSPISHRPSPIDEQNLGIIIAIIILPRFLVILLSSQARFNILRNMHKRNILDFTFITGLVATFVRTLGNLQKNHTSPEFMEIQQKIQSEHFLEIWNIWKKGKIIIF